MGSRIETIAAPDRTDRLSRGISNGEDPSQITINVVSGSDRLRRRSKIGNTAAAIVIGGGAIAGGWALLDKIDFPGIPNFPNIPNILKKLNSGNLANNPPRVDAAVIPETIIVEEEYFIRCLGRVSVGVGTHGNKDELMGGGEMDKIWYGDFMVCGEDREIIARAKIKKTGDKVTAVSVTTPGLEVTQPRVDHTDFRNCADLRTKDTIEQINKKIADFQKQRNPKCDDGFEVSGLYGGSDLANVITTAQTAAQIAMSVDIQPQEVLVDLNERFRRLLEEELRTQHSDVDPEKVTVRLETTEADIKARLLKVAEDLRANRYSVKYKFNDGEPVMNVGAPGGGDVDVTINSINTQEIGIESINKRIGVASQPGKIQGPQVVDNRPQGPFRSRQ